MKQNPMEAARLAIADTVALNALKDTYLILRSGIHLSKFRELYQIIRIWAENRLIYSNRLGFLGGYAWSILVFYVCLHYPKASLRELVGYFFLTWSSWIWSERPVFIPNLKPTPHYQMKPQEHVAILTLTPPYKNITRNITHSTLLVLKEEFMRAQTVSTWSDFLQPCTFFSNFDSYLFFTLSAIQAREYYDWIGYFESRLVNLFVRLEERLQSTTSSIFTHPCTYRYAAGTSNWPYSGKYFIGIKLVPKEKKDILENKEIKVLEKKKKKKK